MSSSTALLSKATAAPSCSLILVLVLVLVLILDKSLGLGLGLVLFLVLVYLVNLDSWFLQLVFYISSPLSHCVYRILLLVFLHYRHSSVYTLSTDFAETSYLQKKAQTAAFFSHWSYSVGECQKHLPNIILQESTLGLIKIQY